MAVDWAGPVGRGHRRRRGGAGRSGGVGVPRARPARVTTVLVGLTGVEARRHEAQAPPPRGHRGPPGQRVGGARDAVVGPATPRPADGFADTPDDGSGLRDARRGQGWAAEANAAVTRGAGQRRAVVAVTGLAGPVEGRPPDVVRRSNGAGGGPGGPMTRRIRVWGPTPWRRSMAQPVARAGQGQRGGRVDRLDHRCVAPQEGGRPRASRPWGPGMRARASQWSPVLRRTPSRAQRAVPARRSRREAAMHGVCWSRGEVGLQGMGPLLLRCPRVLSHGHRCLRTVPEKDSYQAIKQAAPAAQAIGAAIIHSLRRKHSVYPSGRWREYPPPTRCARRASQMPLARAVECVHTHRG